MLFLILHCEIIFSFSFSAENGGSFSFSFIFQPQKKIYFRLFLFYGRKNKIHFRSASSIRLQKWENIVNIVRNPDNQMDRVTLLVTIKIQSNDFNWRNSSTTSFNLTCNITPATKLDKLAAYTSDSVLIYDQVSPVV